MAELSAEGETTVVATVVAAPPSTGGREGVPTVVATVVAAPPSTGGRALVASRAASQAAAAALERIEEVKRRQETARAGRAEADAARLETVHARAETHGSVEKTVGDNGQAGVLKRMWERWLASDHGKAVAERLKGGGAPTLEDVKLFSTHTYCNRKHAYSCTGRQGHGDACGALQIPYMLARCVFPGMGYEGWAELSLAEAREKSKPFSRELRAHWQSLKVQEAEPARDGKKLVKKKWDDQLYFMAQDVCMADVVRVNRAVFRLAVMGFVRVTCSRSGSMARDWFDRAGLAARWVGRNILSVSDFTTSCCPAASERRRRSRARSRSSG
jgi:hypothetical protein